MWVYIVRYILRNRIANLVIIGLITLFMGYHAFRVEMSYEFTSLLPKSDTIQKIYQEFNQRFGKDGSILFIGIEGEDLFTLGKFNAWYDLTNEIKRIDGVEEALSTANLYTLRKNDTLKQFEFKPLISKRPGSQTELDSLKIEILQQPIYKNILFTADGTVTLMAVTLEEQKLNTGKRISLVKKIKDEAENFGQNNGLKMHYSGLPYIRTITSKKLQDELLIFVLIALGIASVLLFIFFRSFKAVFFPMLIVVICTGWALGLMALLGYKITMLTGIFPPLLIVIVVENCIFLLNKYHTEYKLHGNKIKALSRIVQRIGSANLLTNTTTAAGFAAFIITRNDILVEFGVIASISILAAYLLTMILIPVFFSFLPPPKERHVRHLEEGFVSNVLRRVVNKVLNFRNTIYLITFAVLIIGITGVTMLQTTGRIVDDIPQKDDLYKDLMFLEKHFTGVMPFEISIDSKKKKGVMNLATVKKIDRLQQIMEQYPELSRSLSVSDVVKFSKQAFYNGNPAMFSLPNNQEKNFIFSYIPEAKPGTKNILNSFVDTSFRYTRISTQMANIGTYDIKRIREDLRPKIDSVFSPDKYDVTITGTSVVFLEGNRYLVKGLFNSLILAMIIITALMALLFTSIRMIIISLIPNVIPLIMTAGMMGFLNIPIKPSTVLIFSVALGISIDNTIHFLSRYRLQLKLKDWNIRESVVEALKETGFSMVYSSVVLFFGFIIFIFSSFGGTESLGYLIAFTLAIALLSNLFFLPSLILTLDKWITTKTFKEPLLELLDEEDDIEISNLEIENMEDNEAK
ncbi:MAG: MMPL family transporter [Bacteroidales bacterium]|nr:MMPL family transporter [Bacteroidales bacterium]